MSNTPIPVLLELLRNAVRHEHHDRAAELEKLIVARFEQAKTEQDTLRELARYILDGDVFNEVSSEGADYAEQGRYTWPQRWDKLEAKAKEALDKKG